MLNRAEERGVTASTDDRHRYDARRIVLYETLGAPALPRAAADALRRDALDAVLHFSSRSASVFRKGVTKEGLEGACKRLVCCCISRATAAALDPLRFQELRIAAAPNQDALLACLG